MNKTNIVLWLINTIILELFYILSASLLIFTVFELFWPRLVLAYININLILIFWLITGIFIIVNNKLGMK